MTRRIGAMIAALVLWAIVFTPGSAQAQVASSNPPATPQIGHVRTEFVILFIWQEPTPSDGLRTGTGDAK